MEAPLKQRLIGALVLAALALIFIPMLLKSPDVKDPDSADVSLQIPEEPDEDGIKTIDMTLDSSATAVPTPAVSDEMPVPEDDASLDGGQSISDGPEQVSEFYAVVIPVASDTDAQQRLKALRGLGLSGSIQSNGAAFRLRIGPYPSRELAESARLRAADLAKGGTVVALSTAEASAATAEAPVIAAPADKPASKPVATPSAAKAPPAAVATPVAPAKTNSTAMGFAVQIGAPASEQSALMLRDKARAAGFTSYIQPVETAGGRRYRVRIGPESTRAQAAASLATVKQKLGIDGIIVPHP